MLEDRLSSIAATTMILSNTAQSNTTEIVEQIESLQQRLDTADAVGSKVDELHQRVIEVESRAPSAGSGVESADVTREVRRTVGSHRTGRPAGRRAGATRRRVGGPPRAAQQPAPRPSTS